jgi:peptidoglycan/xylan/chitin deacetylase (PgdA/CDA1 family)
VRLLPRVPSADRLLGSLQSVSTTDRTWSLTFDDGPHAHNTPEILRALAQRGARATFFVIVRNATAHPGLVAQASTEGHEIALHGMDHVDLTACTLAKAVSTVRVGKDRLEQLLGHEIRFFRPPYGTQRLLTYAIARASGLEVVGWTSSPRDFLAIDIDRQATIALDELTPGGIMLLHDGGPSLPERRRRLLEAVLDRTESGGWTPPVPVGELLHAGEPVRRLWFQRRAHAMISELRPFYWTDEAVQPAPSGAVPARDDSNVGRDAEGVPHARDRSHGVPRPAPGRRPVP